MKLGGDHSFWLYIHPHVHMSYKRSHVIFYNTLNGALLEYRDCDIRRMVGKLNYDWNLNVIRLRKDELTPKVDSFIHDIRRFFIGDVIEASIKRYKPVQLKPIPKLKKISKELLTSMNKSLLEMDEIYDCLDHVTLYINEDCQLDCTLCNDAFRQFTFCHKSDRAKNELDIDDLRGLFEELQRFRLIQLDIIGGNIFRYSKLAELFQLLHGFKTNKHFYVHILNIKERLNVDFFSEDRSNVLDVLIHLPMDRSLFKQKAEYLNKLDVKKVFHFVVNSEDNLTQSEQLISDFQIEEFRFHPFFDGSNLDFFKEHVFIDKESLLSNRLSMNEIFTREKLNASDFKKITVRSDNSIYANVNHSLIGVLGKDRLTRTIARELNDGKSWNRVRKYVSPCKSCVYNALCPPISNYEYVLKRYNLCNIYMDRNEKGER